jgi:hypothetical protein
VCGVRVRSLIIDLVTKLPLSLKKWLSIYKKIIICFKE